MSRFVKTTEVHDMFTGSDNLSFTAISGYGQYQLNPDIELESIAAGSIEAESIDAGSIEAESIDAGSIEAGSIEAESIDVNSINIAGSPSVDTHAATVGYVKNFVQGLDAKESVKCATTGNITLEVLQSIDGVNLATGDRVLVKDQTDNTKNGIYLAKSGVWQRALDFDAPSEVQGAFVFVEQGTQNVGKGFVQVSTAPVGIGEGPLIFTQFNGTSQEIKDSINAKAVKSVVDASFGLINTALDGKQNTIVDGGLTIAKTSGLQSALDAKAVKSVVDASFTAILNEPANKVTTSQTATPAIGSMYYDTTGEGRLYMYNGTAWRYISFP
jgi:hypothetical protein